MKMLKILLPTPVEEVNLNHYKPVLFLKEQPGIFQSIHFDYADKLKLYQLDKEGCLYSTIKFSPSFLKKIDNNKIGFFAFKYIIRGNELKYALVLKSFIRMYPKYIALK